MMMMSRKRPYSSTSNGMDSDSMSNSDYGECGHGPTSQASESSLSKRERNRQIAKNNRDRKKEEVRELQETVKFLKRKNQALLNEMNQSPSFLSKDRHLSLTFDREFTATVLSILDQLRTQSGSESTAFYVINATSHFFPIVCASHALSELTGYPMHEIVGQNCGFLSGPQTSRNERERLNQALQQGQDITTTLLNYRKNSSTFWNKLHLANVSTMLPTRELAPYLIIGLHTEVISLKGQLVDCASTEKDDFHESGSSSSGPASKGASGAGGGNLGMNASSSSTGSNMDTQQEGSGNTNTNTSTNTNTATMGTTTGTTSANAYCPCGGIIQMLPSSSSVAAYAYHQHQHHQHQHQQQQQHHQEYERDEDDHTILQDIITSHRHALHSRNSSNNYNYNANSHTQSYLTSEIDSSFQVPNTFPEDSVTDYPEEPENWGRYRTESAMSVLTNNTDLETTYSTPTTAASVFASLKVSNLSYTEAVDSSSAPASCFQSLAPVSPPTTPQRSGAATHTSVHAIPGIEGMSSQDLPSMSTYFTSERRAVRDIPPYPHISTPTHQSDTAPQHCHRNSRSSSANSTCRSPINPTELRRNYFSALEKHFNQEDSEEQGNCSVPPSVTQFKVSLSNSSAFSPIQRTPGTGTGIHTTPIMPPPTSTQAYNASSSNILSAPVYRSSPRSSSVAKKVSFSHGHTQLGVSAELGEHPKAHHPVLDTNLEFDYDQELSQLNHASTSACAERADTPRFHYH